MPYKRKADRFDFPRKRAKGNKGLTLPGYNYLGPFNSEDNGEPTNEADRAADVHDKEYGVLSRNHGYWKPYFNWNEADEKFLKRIQDSRDYGARVARGVFGAKQFLAKHGILGTIPNKKRPREEQALSTAKRYRATRNDDLAHTMHKRPRQSLANFQAIAQAGMPESGSGNTKGLTETPVDDPKGSWDIHRGPPSYTFASLPFIETRNINTSCYARDYVWRMTSPYDPGVSIASIDINTGAGTATWLYGDTDANDATAAKTRWYDFYSGLYKYYHVIAARWTLVVENLTNENVWCHQLYCNDTTPPVGATNDDMLCWTDCKSYLMGSHAVAVASTGALEANNIDLDAANDEDGATPTGLNYETGNHVQRKGGLGPILKLSGEYRPGDFAREVRLDSEVENWTAVTANPSLTERLLFRFKHFDQGVGDNDALSYNRTLNLQLHLKIEYLVEFKELKDGVKWPVNKQPLTVTVSTDIN